MADTKGEANHDFCFCAWFSGAGSVFASVACSGCSVDAITDLEEA